MWGERGPLSALADRPQDMKPDQPRRTPATEVMALVQRIRQAPNTAQLVAIRDEVMQLPVGDLDAEMLQLGIASRERALLDRAAPVPVVPVRERAASPVGAAMVRKFVLSRAAPIRPVVNHLPRRIRVQRRTVVLSTG